MGYTEQVCQICGIPFNIARIRSPDEPEEAGWQSYHYDYVTQEDTTEPCEAPGCTDKTRVPNAEAEPEHLAGPDCVCTLGYSSWRITTEEMQARPLLCQTYWGDDMTNTYQDRLKCICLARKEDDWSPEPDDEPFEIASKHCFVTGITSQAVDDFDVEGLTPARHGLSETMVDNNRKEDEYDDRPAIPMHPGCFFGLFRRASLQRFGHVNIDGLWMLRETHGDYENRFQDFPKSPDLGIVVDQWYYCEVGTEYLASNPVHIDGLTELLASCKQHDGTTNHTVFEARAGNTTDIFGKLPSELNHLIIYQLDRCDLANLRLASRAFSQLPQHYFKARVLAEMPWLWEVEEFIALPMNWYDLWCRLAAADGGNCGDEKFREYRHLVPRLKSEELFRSLADQGLTPADPAYDAEYKKGNKQAKAEADAEVEAAIASGQWPLRAPKPTELRGLRNRRRIYQDLQIIMDRIAALPTENIEE